MSFAHLVELLFTSAFLWLILGALLGAAFGIPSSLASTFLKQVCVRGLLPLMILSKVLEHYEPSQPFALLPYGVLALAFCVVNHLGSLALAKVIPIRQHLPTFHLGNTINNYGFIAYGIVETLVGPAAMPFLFVYVMIYELLIWTWGIRIIRKGQGSQKWTSLISPPAMGLLAGILLKTLGVDPGAFAPLGWLLDFANFAAVPLALLGIGSVICASVRAATRSELFCRDVPWVVGYRHLLFPLMATPLVLLLLPPGPLRSIGIVQCFMPMALMPVTLATLYGGEPRPLSVSVCLSMLLSILTLPLALSLMGSHILPYPS